MKAKIFLILVLLSHAFVWAQDLQIPNTPAFSILGYEPSSVMRPNNTKKLSTDVLNSFDENGKLKMNLGMEVAPYWLKSRPELTRDEYLNNDSWKLFVQSLSLSAATVQDSVTGTNNLGIGFRAQLIRGKLSDEFEQKEKELKELETTIATIATARGMAGRSITTIDAAVIFIQTTLQQLKNSGDISEDAYNKAIEACNYYKNNYNDDTASIVKFCEAVNEHFAEKATMDELAGKVIEAENKRIGFSLEVASAAKFQTESHDQAFQKFGIWLNANNYFTDTDAWTVTARFMAHASDTTSYNFDSGLGYIKEGKDFNISVEAMARWYRDEIPDINSMGDAIIRVEKEFTYRLAAQASYNFTENISFNISFGKDFEDERLTGNSFFSIFGFNYSIFNKQKVKLNI